MTVIDQHGRRLDARPTLAWEKYPTETPQAWEAFRTYRDMGLDRSIRKAAEHLGKSSVLLEGWSRKHSWVSRASAWDAEQDRIWNAGQAKGRREMAERHAKIANVMLGKAVQRLQAIDPASLSPTELVKWVEAAAKVERLARGEPTRLELTGKDGGPISLELGLSDEERRARLEQLQREVATRLGGAAALGAGGQPAVAAAPD